MVYLGGTNINGELIRNGYAWLFIKYCKVDVCNDWMAYQMEASFNKRGLWADPNPVPPWDYRRNKMSTNTQENYKSQKAFSPPPQVSTSNTQPIAAGIYHGNVKSGAFHAPSCRHFNCKNCTRTFTSRNEAVAAGYHPCGDCKP